MPRGSLVINLDRQAIFTGFGNGSLTKAVVCLTKQTNHALAFILLTENVWGFFVVSLDHQEF